MATADSEGDTPIHFAAGVGGAEYASEELALRLVLAGASLSTPNSNGFTPLDASLLCQEAAGPLVLHIRTRMLQNVIQAPVWLQARPHSEPGVSLRVAGPRD